MAPTSCKASMVSWMAAIASLRYFLLIRSSPAVAASGPSRIVLCSTAVPTALRRQRHFDEFIASRRCRTHFGRYRRSVVTHHGPDIGPEHDQREFPARQVLLVPDFLIGSNHHVESRRFRRLE